MTESRRSSGIQPGRDDLEARDPQVGARVEAYVKGAELGSVAAVLRARRDEILRRWLAAARRQPFHAAHPERAVADHIPQLFDALVAFLERHAPSDVDPNSSLADPSVHAMAQAHARDRFRQGLGAPDVLTEFRLLRQEIGRALRQQRAGASDAGAAELLVHDALDGATTLALAALEAREAEYHHIAAELAAIVASSSDAIFSTTLEGIITSWNPAAGRLYGYTAAEAIGHRADLIIPADRPHELPSILARIGRGERVEPYETVRVRKDGGRIDVSVTISPIRDGAGTIVGASAIARDISEQKRAEAAARQAQAELEAERGLLDALLRTAPVGFAFLDHDLRYVRINERLAEINGRSATDHLGRAGRELMPELADQVEPLLRRVLETGESILDVPVSAELPSRPGEVRYWRVSHYPVRGATGAIVGVGVVAVETTAQVRAEAALRESEERFRTLADNISQFAWMADAQGWIFWYNRRWFEYTGTTLEEMQGWGWTRVHHPEHVERVVARIQHAWETGEPWEDTFPLRGKDGQYRWFLSRAVPIRDPSGAIVRWFGTNTDITELRQAQQAQQVLAEAAHAFAAASLNTRALLETIAQRGGEALGDTCVVHLRVGDGPLLEPAAIYHADPAVAKLVQTLLTQAPARLDEDIMAEVARTGQAVCVPDISLQEQRRRVKPAYWSFLERVGASSVALAPLRVGGQVLGTLGVSRDRPGRAYTSDEVQLLQNLADRAALVLEAARRFEQAQAALAARDEVLAAVSHDLKSPLTAISGSAQLLQQQLKLVGVADERTLGTVERIVANCRRMTDMMNELVDTARLEAGQLLVLDRAPTDLMALVRAAVADQQATSGRHTLHLSGTADEVSGMWDAARLRRVLDNLLANAIKYSPQGGEVAVEVATEEAAGARWAVVRIADQGLGIPAADLPHIFERFHRGRNVAGIGGTGLGLSGAKQLVEQHGGRLEVSSEEGVGSTFSVWLPLAAEQPSH